MIRKPTLEGLEPFIIHGWQPMDKKNPLPPEPRQGFKMIVHQLPLT